MLCATPLPEPLTEAELAGQVCGFKHEAGGNNKPQVFFLYRFRMPLFELV
jgi:hypothetical protein